MRIIQPFDFCHCGTTYSWPGPTRFTPPFFFTAKGPYSSIEKKASRFARHAFRRDVSAAELTPYLNLAAQTRRDGAGFEESIAAALEAILVSPDFLFRIETVSHAKAAAAPISSFALASRLSYFLWSSMPDDQLLSLARQNSLRQPVVLKAQIARMLKDPKAKALVENFAGQWLELRRLESVAPDPVKRRSGRLPR